MLPTEPSAHRRKRLAAERDAGSVAAKQPGAGLGRALLPLLVLELGLWAFLFLGAHLFLDGPNGKSLGVDFAVFLGGAQVMREGGNPYDPASLYPAEYRLLTRQGIPVTTHRNLVRLGNPPILYWALEPLVTRPFAPTALIWIGAMYILSAAGLTLVIPRLLWRTVLPALLLLPQVVIGAAYANVTGLVFASLAAGTALGRRHPLMAGLVLTPVWLKPQVGLPFALLLALFEVKWAVRTAIGFAAGTLGLFLLMLAAVGGNVILDWWQGLFTFSRSVALQPNLVSVSGLYASWSPDSLRTALTAAALLIALALTWWAWNRSVRSQSDRVRPAWLWLVWLLGTPYAHFPDEIVLAIPLAAVLAEFRPGREPSAQVGGGGAPERRASDTEVRFTSATDTEVRATSVRDTEVRVIGIRRTGSRVLPVVLIYTLFFSLLLLPQIGGVSLLPLPLVGLCIPLVRRWRRTELLPTAETGSVGG